MRKILDILWSIPQDVEFSIWKDCLAVCKNSKLPKAEFEQWGGENTSLYWDSIDEPNLSIDLLKNYAKKYGWTDMFELGSSALDNAIKFNSKFNKILRRQDGVWYYFEDGVWTQSKVSYPDFTIKLIIQLSEYLNSLGLENYSVQNGTEKILKLYKGMAKPLPPTAPKYLLNVKNGIVDIRDFSIKKHSPDYYFNYYIDVDYKPTESTCDKAVRLVLGERLLGTIKIDFLSANFILPHIKNPDWYCIVDMSKEEFLSNLVIGANEWLTEGLVYDSLIPAPVDGLIKFIYDYCALGGQIEIEDFLESLRQTVNLPVTDNRILMVLSQIDNIYVTPNVIKGLSWKA